MACVRYATSSSSVKVWRRGTERRIYRVVWTSYPVVNEAIEFVDLVARPYLETRTSHEALKICIGTLVVLDLLLYIFIICIRSSGVLNRRPSARANYMSLEEEVQKFCHNSSKHWQLHA
jgi:hypothetical protein